MGRELRSFRLAEMVMKKTDYKYNYKDVLEKAKEACKKTRPNPFSHVGDEHLAGVIANGFLGVQKYY